MKSDDSRQNIPPGIKVFSKVGCHTPQKFREKRTVWYQASILIITYLIYTSYRIIRKAPSVVKNVLNQNCSQLVPPEDIEITAENQESWCNWAPFDESNADSLLGAVDSAMMAGYAGGMFITGWLGDRLPLRTYMTCSMLAIAMLNVLYGMEYYLQIHHIAYFIIIQVFNGIFQSTGSPSTCKCVGQWFNKNRGLVFGIWNSNCFVGNILGNLIAGSFVDYNWSLSFIVPSIILAFSAFLCFFFLPTDPSDVGCELEQQEDEDSETQLCEENTKKNGVLVENAVATRENKLADDAPISILEALKVPGVIEYSLSIFCAKLVSYTFMFWLPRYIKLTSTLSAQDSAFLSSMFDVGGILGSSLIGVMSDKIGSGAIACGIMITLAFPSTILYKEFGDETLGLSITLLVIVGLVISAPYALITTVIPTDLGSHESLRGNNIAISTMVGIVNGCGSVGATLGPLLAGILTDKDVDFVFWMIYAFNFGSLVFLTRLIVKDTKKLIKARREVPPGSPTKV